MPQFPHLLEAVEIARASLASDGREMTADALRTTCDAWLLGTDPCPVLSGDHNGPICGDVIDVSYRDGSLYADLAIDDATYDAIRDGKLIGISIDNSSFTLVHVAILPKAGAIRELPPLQEYIADDDEPEQESSMESEYKFGALKTHAVKVQPWRDESAGQFADRRTSTQMTPNEAGGKLAELAKELQRTDPTRYRTFEAAMEHLRHSDEGRKLFAIWASRSTGPQVKSFGFGQTAPQRTALEYKRAATAEIDRRARVLVRGGLAPSYAEAVNVVLAEDDDLRRNYQRC